MLTQAKAREIALGFLEAEEEPHFEATSFRVAKKIFATMGAASGKMVVKFTADQQSMLTTTQSDIFAPVPGHWGRYGWTEVTLKKANAEVLRHAVTLAYRNVAPKALLKRLDAS